MMGQILLIFLAILPKFANSTRLWTRVELRFATFGHFVCFSAHRPLSLTFQTASVLLLWSAEAFSGDVFPNCDTLQSSLTNFAHFSTILLQFPC